MAYLRAIIAVVAALLMTLPALAAEGEANAAFDGASIDLYPFLQALETDKPAVSVELPVAETGNRVLMQLNAVGKERIHRWAVVTVANPSLLELQLVIVTPFQGFVDSGVIWPKPSGSRIQNVIVAGPAATRPLPTLGADSLALDMKPGQMATIAFELTPAGLNDMTMWKAPAFAARESSFAFLRGVVLGIAMLMVVAMISLYAIRVNAVFPFGALFALASVGFIALEVGYLPALNAMLAESYRIGEEGRAVVEGLMLTGLILCLVSFVDLRKRWPIAGNVLLLVGALSLAIPVYGWFEPAPALGIARIGFALAAVGGFAVIVALWREKVIRAQASLLTWSLIVLWTFAAAIAVLTPARETLWSPMLIAGLVLVLLTMGFTLAQFAFSHGFIAQRLFEESGRRALALAGSQQYVWDWQVDDQSLHVGEDLERSLGLVPGEIERGGPDAWLEVIHPGDRKAYIVALEAAERRGHGALSLEFRLRRGDGTYRWFNLRGRVMPGSDRRPLRCIGTLTDVTGTRRAQEQLLNDAVYDRVTGLPNRALLIDRMERAIAAIGEGQPNELYVLMIDLDRFTAVNDGLGYEAGDGLLNITGRRLAAVADPEDTVARLPGDQFAILFSAAKAKRDITAFTESVRKAISRPISIRTHEIFLTASLGVAALREKGQSVEDLLKDASIALYEAKRRGKDTVEFFRISMRDDRSELVALESELRRALERNEIEVVYQPIARLADMDLAGFEALIRWRHRTFGVLGPDTFMPVAETTGIIKDLGRFVLNDAARNLGIWQRAFRSKEPLFVAVNISSSQLIGTALIEEVKAIMAREGIQRDTLKIEITESMVMQNPELSAQVLDRLKQLGVGLACDDFGTGYSSLSNLRRMPFDVLKVDRSFIEPEPDDEKATIILETILLLAHDLGLVVVAEGIQSQAHVDRLGELECDMGQGNFIGEPMTAKQVVDALSGLPYAASRNKSVIAALWERVARGDGIAAPSPVWQATPDSEEEAPLVEADRPEDPEDEVEPPSEDGEDRSFAPETDSPPPVVHPEFDRDRRTPEDKPQFTSVPPAENDVEAKVEERGETPGGQPVPERSREKANAAEREVFRAARLKLNQSARGGPRRSSPLFSNIPMPPPLLGTAPMAPRRQAQTQTQEPAILSRIDPPPVIKRRTRAALEAKESERLSRTFAAPLARKKSEAADPQPGVQGEKKVEPSIGGKAEAQPEWGIGSSIAANTEANTNEVAEPAAEQGLEAPAMDLPAAERDAEPVAPSLELTAAAEIDIPEPVAEPTVAPLDAEAANSAKAGETAPEQDGSTPAIERGEMKSASLPTFPDSPGTEMPTNGAHAAEICHQGPSDDIDSATAADNAPAIPVNGAGDEQEGEADTNPNGIISADARPLRPRNDRPARKGRRKGRGKSTKTTLSPG